MKKFVKILMLCAVAMVVPGVVLTAVGAAFGGDLNAAMNQTVLYGGNMSAMQIIENTTETEAVEQETISIGGSYLPDGVENVRNLDISVDTESVELNKGDAFSVVNSGLNDSQITSYIKGNTWYIEVTGGWKNRGSLYITVPETVVFDAIRLHSDVGRITGTGADSVYFEADTDTGKIKLTDVNAQMMQLDADVGTIEIWGTVPQAANLHADAGTVELRVPKPAEYGYEITCEMGKVTLFDETFSGMQEHRRFNMDQTHLLTPVPLFTLDCEMGTVKVLESDNDSVGETCWENKDTITQGTGWQRPHHDTSSRHREYCE